MQQEQEQGWTNLPLLGLPAYSFILKKWAARSSETSVNICQITERHTPDDSKLHSHLLENLETYLSTNTVRTILYVNNRVYEVFRILGYNAVSSVESQPTVRKNISPPSSESNNKPIKKLLLPVSCFLILATLKMEATCSSETLVDFQRTIRRCIPKDRTLHNHRCENLRPYN
jgi:hypothetical protein